MAATWRASVPQQPPSTVTAGNRLAQCGVLGGEIGRITLVQLGRLVELGVALRGCVRAQANEALPPWAVLFQRLGEVRRVRTVDHEVRGAGIRRGVHLFDRLAQRLARRKPAVGLDGERDRRRNTRRRRGTHDTDRLLGVGHRDCGDLVGRRVRERADLHRVVMLGLLGRHRVAGVVAVPARADAAAHHDGDAVRRRSRPDLLCERHRRAVGGVELLGRVPELGTPVRVRAPRGCLDNEARVELACDVEITVVVAAQSGAVVRVVEQRERRKARQVDSVVEDQLRLQTSVGHEQPVAVGLR